MNHSTYSFADVSLVFSHPSVGMITITGEGVGTITISRANDVSQHDVAADGSVMTSKIIIKNGTAAIDVQQTSAAHKFFKRWYDYLQVAPTSEWTKASAILRHPAIGETIIMSGISPQKRPDAAFQQSGQHVTWNLMATEIDG